MFDLGTKRTPLFALTFGFDTKPTHQAHFIFIDTRAGVLRTFLSGPRRDLVLLTATPVNNNLYDLYHLLSFFLKQDSQLLNKGVLSIKAVFDQASKINPGDLHPDKLYPIIDATTVKRTRQFVKKHYADDRIPGPDGRLVPITFPQPIARSVRYSLQDVMSGFFDEFAEALMPEEGDPALTLARYQPQRYLKQPDSDEEQPVNFIGLLRAGLLKRFESSAHAFANTCRKMAHQHELFLASLDNGHVLQPEYFRELSPTEDFDDDMFDEHVEAADQYDLKRLREDVQNDLTLLTRFTERSEAVEPEDDPKLQALVEELAVIAKQANDDSLSDDERQTNQKVLVFSYYNDTAQWIRDWMTKQVQCDDRLVCYRERLAITSGSSDGVRTLDAETASWGFAPESAAPAHYTDGDLYDLLITTDVLAEGVNLQQCRNIVNYDLPWNPMRLVQRHGRIDRLLSRHKRVYQRTFFPDDHLDRLLKLEARVRTKLQLASASVGVPVAPIEGGAVGGQIFSESRDEIERLAQEDSDLFDKGGGGAAAQTGEEYRQQLRKALLGRQRDDIVALPRMVGSGMRRGVRSGHFFCAKIGLQTYLRFVPDDRESPDDIVDELGTCLRLIECEYETSRIEVAREPVYVAWQEARDHIWGKWDFFTDPANLQPKVRKLNREAADYLSDTLVDGIDEVKLQRTIDTLLSPWPRLLRYVTLPDGWATTD